jgi:Ca2+/Na+ antiporter
MKDNLEPMNIDEPEEDDESKESIYSMMNKNNVFVIAIFIIAIAIMLSNNLNIIFGLAIIVLSLLLLKIRGVEEPQEHEPAEVYNDVANSFTGEQIGITDIRKLNTFNTDLDRPKLRIQTISENFILFLWKDRTAKPIGMLCKKKYKKNTVPLLDLFTSDVVDVDVPEIIRLSERDLYGQKNRELKFARDMARRSYKNYTKEEE